MFTYSNNFHNTTYNSSATPKTLERIANTHPSDWTTVEKTFVTKMHNKLCGSPDCTCGDIFGRRGAQTYEYDL